MLGSFVQLTYNANITGITKHITLYCNYNDDLLLLFFSNVVFENEIRLRGFNFKVLRGIRACNKNLKNLRIRLDDRYDVVIKF